MEVFSLQLLFGLFSSSIPLSVYIVNGEEQNGAPVFAPYDALYRAGTAACRAPSVNLLSAHVNGLLVVGYLELRL
jgi:hypothetical protein